MRLRDGVEEGHSGATTAAAPAATCPVCAWPIGNELECGECGWRLHSGWVLGAVTAGMERAFLERLGTAQRRFDLAAAARAAGFPHAGDPALLSRLEAFVRAGPPLPDEHAEAARVTSTDGDASPAAAARTPQEAGRSAMAQLVGGTLDAVVVVVVDADGITATTIRADELGVPWPLADPARWPWASLLPSLPDEADERRFQLAGGVGDRPPDRVVIDGALQRALPASLAGPRTHVLLVCRVPGWTVPERALQVLRGRQPHSEVAHEPPSKASASDTVSELIRHAPLRHRYDLVLATIDTGSHAVRLRPQPLFQPGATSVPDHPQAVVAVLGPPAHAEELALAVVVCRGDSPGAWRPLRVGRARLRPGAREELRISLEGPGRVRFLHPSGVVDHERTWGDLLAQVPERLDPGSLLPVDLVCAVELAGDAEVVEARLRLLRETIALIDHEHPAPGLVRVGLLGYEDHNAEAFRMRGDHRRRVVRGMEPGSAAAAGSELGKWAPQPLKDPAAAPLEDALYTLERMLRRAGDARNVVLVTVASRPPHPSTQDDYPQTLRCPNGRNWRELLTRVRTRTSLSCIGVRDRSWDPARVGAGASRYSRSFWRAVGDTRLVLQETDARELARATGLLPSGRQTLPFPLDAATRLTPAGTARRPK